ncbi:hypothetical protein ACO2I3_12445 [Leptospira interrogans]
MIVTAAWAYLSPWLGPLLLWARQSAWLAPVVSIFGAWRAILLGAVLLAAIAGVVWLRWPEEKITVTEAAQRCEDARLRAELTATKAALRIAEATLRLRATAIDSAESYITALNEELEKIRAEAPDPDASVFDAGDPWLLGQRRR